MARLVPLASRAQPNFTKESIGDRNIVESPASPGDFRFAAVSSGNVQQNTSINISEMGAVHLQFLAIASFKETKVVK